MENQVSGPLGTGVGSPLGSSQSATEAAQVPGPLTTLYSRNSFTSAAWFSRRMHNMRAALYPFSIFFYPPLQPATGGYSIITG